MKKYTTRNKCQQQQHQQQTTIWLRQCYRQQQYIEHIEFVCLYVALHIAVVYLTAICVLFFFVLKEKRSAKGVWGLYSGEKNSRLLLFFFCFFSFILFFIVVVFNTFLFLFHVSSLLCATRTYANLHIKHTLIQTYIKIFFNEKKLKKIKYEK